MPKRHGLMDEFAVITKHCSVLLFSFRYFVNIDSVNKSNDGTPSLTLSDFAII